MIAQALWYALPIVIWSIVAQDAWSFRWQYRPRSGLYRLLPLLTTTMAIMYLVHMFAALFLPAVSEARAPRWFDLTDVATMAAVAQFRHVARYFRLNASPPSRRWLAVTYGSAALVALINVFPELIPAASIEQQMGIARGVLMPYVIVSLYLTLRQLRGFARPGGWRPGSMVARYADLTMLALGIGLAALLYFWFATVIGPEPTVGFVQPPPWLNASVGLVFAVPFAARMVGHMVKRLAKVCAVLLAAVATYIATQMLSAAVDREVASILAIGCWSALVLVFANQNWLDAIIDRWLLRSGHSRRAELDGFMRSLSPDIGALQCCQRVVDELVRIFQLRGAVILLARDSKVALAGTIRVEPLLRVWNDGRCIDGLPARPFSLASFRELSTAMQEAFVEAEIVGMLPIVSPRRRWGAAFATASPISASMNTADRQEMQNLASQLARILDATELIDRVVAVERSLAHADKLAAIGETAARIAHDIRNPVTAARSLAQQLVRDSDAGDTAESAALILAELERVEHQVASLLRFARRDEYRFAAVDVGALVRAALDSVRARASAAHVTVQADVHERITAHADGEKMRQVLLNLFDNALDAMAQGTPDAQMRVTVTRANGHAHVTIADNGPGVPADSLPHLFEPFFSLKEKGTGLGLAIVKRTIDAHHGRIEAAATDPGMTFAIELPLTTDDVTKELPSPTERGSG